MKTLRTLLGVGIVSLLLFELALQALSLFAHFTFRSGDKSPDSPSHGQSVLCVGDSYTYGFGASSTEFSYPEQLGGLLGEGSWEVSTAAFPGKNSAEAFDLALPQIEAGGIHTMILLIGGNDVWSLPPKIEIPEDLAGAAARAEQEASSWRLECRTLRLLRTFRQRDAWRDKEPAPAGGSAAASLRPAGFSTGPSSRFLRDRVTTGAPETPVALFSPSSTETSLPSTGAGGTPPEERDPSLPATAYEPVSCHNNDHFEMVWRALYAGEPEKVDRYLQQWEEETLEEKVAKTSALTHVAGISGKPEENRELMTTLYDLLLSAGKGEVSESKAIKAISLFTMAGNWQQGVAPCEKFIGEFPESPLLLFFGSQLQYNAGDFDRAVELNDRSTALAGDGADAYFWKFRGKVYLGRDPFIVAESYVESFNRDPSTPTIGSEIHANGGELTDAHFEAAYQKVGVSPQIRGTIEHFREQSREGRPISLPDSGGDGVGEVLQHNLQQFITLCQRKGIRTVLVSYPFKDPGIWNAQKQSAEEAGVIFVDNSTVFREAMESGLTYEDLFISDGHCNDRGYGLMAEAVHAAVWGGAGE